jgi:hypothetical protein
LFSHEIALEGENVELLRHIAVLQGLVEDGAVEIAGFILEHGL